MNHLSPLACAALGIVTAAGGIIRTRYGQQHTIRHKGRIDLVTETDIAVEAFLKERLGALLPGTAFLAEESSGDGALPDTCWIIDPVDGTTNFAHGLPFVGISVALQKDGEPVLGIVAVPLLAEYFVAEKGKGAWCNGEELHVSRTTLPEDALVATGFPYDVDQRTDVIVRRLQPVLAVCQGIRRCGAAALDLAWTACGRFDAYYEDGLKPWDSAAGILLVREAGGCVTAMNGGPYTLHSPLLASNGLLHQTILQLLIQSGTV